MSKFDKRKFEAVRKLMEEGATEGERKAAKAAAQRMAEKAGMSLDEAVLGQQPEAAATTSRSFFDDMFDTPEFGAMRKERALREAKIRSEAIKHYGSEDAVFADTEREALLSQAVEPFKVWAAYVDENGQPQRYVRDLKGWNSMGRLDEADPRLIKCVEEAYPIPAQMHGVLEEVNYWSHLYQVRNAFGLYEHWYWVEIRVRLLEDALHNRPVQTWEDLDARMQWIGSELDSVGWFAGLLPDLLQRLMEDHRILRNARTTGVQDRHVNLKRTNAQKADLVKRLLNEMPNASAREIADRAGVSPQTVLNWKRRIG